jgi:hypothetical protein
VLHLAPHIKISITVVIGGGRILYSNLMAARGEFDMSGTVSIGKLRDFAKFLRLLLRFGDELSGGGNIDRRVKVVGGMSENSDLRFVRIFRFSFVESWKRNWEKMTRGQSEPGKMLVVDFVQRFGGIKRTNCRKKGIGM